MNDLYMNDLYMNNLMYEQLNVWTTYIWTTIIIQIANRNIIKSLQEKTFIRFALFKVEIRIVNHVKWIKVYQFNFVLSNNLITIS